MVLQSSFGSAQTTKTTGLLEKHKFCMAGFPLGLITVSCMLGCLDGMISSLVIWKRIKYILGLAHALYSETKEISTCFNGMVSNLGESCKCIAKTVTRFCDVRAMLYVLYQVSTPILCWRSQSLSQAR